MGVTGWRRPHCTSTTNTVWSPSCEGRNRGIPRIEESRLGCRKESSGARSNGSSLPGRLDLGRDCGRCRRAT